MQGQDMKFHGKNLLSQAVTSELPPQATSYNCHQKATTSAESINRQTEIKMELEAEVSQNIKKTMIRNKIPQPTAIPANLSQTEWLGTLWASV